MAKVEVLGVREIQRAACCSLAGCFSTNSNVEANVTNIVTDAKELRILGLSGVYNQVLVDGMPLIQGLAYPYGPGSYPGTMIEKIFVTKGANSVLQGFESISGQINIEFHKAETAPKLFLNAFANSFGETQYNANYMIKKTSWSNLAVGHLTLPATIMDRDKAFDDVKVSTLVAGDAYSVDEDSKVSVPAPGVLTNDTEMFGNALSVTLLTAPVYGVLTLTNNGGFVYVPNQDYFGGDSFTYQANDGATNVGSATVIVKINPVNDSPSLPAQTNRTIDELTFLSVINTASVVDTAATSLTYQLINPPGGMVISTNGVITWTPSEAQGPSTNTITTVVSDGLLSATNSFVVVVTEVNVAPVFVGTPTNRSIEMYSG